MPTVCFKGNCNYNTTIKHSIQYIKMDLPSMVFIILTDECVVECNLFTKYKAQIHDRKLNCVFEKWFQGQNNFTSDLCCAI